jgi:hypothetical protein
MVGRQVNVWIQPHQRLQPIYNYRGLLQIQSMSPWENFVHCNLSDVTKNCSIELD